MSSTNVTFFLGGEAGGDRGCDKVVKFLFFGGGVDEKRRTGDKMGLETLPDQGLALGQG